MGICESDLNSKGINIEAINNSPQQNINSSKIISLKGNIDNNLNINFQENLPDSNPKDKFNLQKYEPSLIKASEVSNSNLNQSDLNSKSNGEELIIKNKVNTNCENKENDFNNQSFMNLIKKNGGIVLKAETNDKFESNNQQGNNILSDLDNGEISDIKSKNSFDDISLSKNSLLNALNGKKNKYEKQSEITKGKYTDYILVHNNLNLGSNIYNDNKSKYTTNTIKPRINLDKYLNGIFSNDYAPQSNNNNGYIPNIDNQLYNIPNVKPINYFKNMPIYGNVNNGSNYNNTNDTIREELGGSFISVPKQDQIIPDTYFNMNENEDIISIISSH